MTEKEILLLLVKQGDCTSICCRGKKESGQKSYLNKIPCPFFDTNVSGGCEVTFGDYTKDKIFFVETRKAAEKKLEEIKKLEFLENLK